MKVENYVMTTSEQLQNNSEKAQKMTFLTPKKIKTWMSICPKSSMLAQIIIFSERFLKKIYAKPKRI